MATVEIDEIVAMSDIARLCGVSQPTASNWRKRHETFPEPFTTVANGNTPLFRKSAIVKWYIDYQWREMDPALMAELLRRAPGAPTPHNQEGDR